MTSHAKDQFARQHRIFLFQIVLINRFARFVRWDRSGAVVTESFDYMDNPKLLAEFLWRFDHMSDEQRGFDPSARLASLKEKRLFECAVEEFLRDMKTGSMDGAPVRSLPGAELTLDDTKTYPTWKVHLVDSISRKTADLIIRRPFSEHLSLWGRATRAYLAYDLKCGRLLCLKDAWRLDDPDLRAESKTYHDLQHHGIPHIPRVLYGGDVRGSNRRGQETLSQTFTGHDHPWRVTACSLEKHIHHRLVQEIAYPLENALDEQEYIQVFCDVLHGKAITITNERQTNRGLAIEKAYDTAGILHRDVSYRNIMIDQDGRGILNDWDHAGPKGELARGIVSALI